MAPPLLRALLRTPVPTETLTRRLLRILPRSTSLKEPSRNPYKSRTLFHDPLVCTQYVLRIGNDMAISVGYPDLQTCLC